MKGNNVIYAVKVGSLSSGGLKMLDVKIGKTTNLKSTLSQYKRSHREVEVLDLWKPNREMELSDCEKGVHKTADRYAHDRDGEVFIFLQDSYKEFADNVSHLLKHTTKTRLKKDREGKAEGEGKYTLERHLERGGEKSREWFQSLEERILELDDDIVEKSLKQYVAYKLNGNFAEVVVQKGQLRVTLDIPPEELGDPKNRVEDKSDKGHWATGDQMFYAKSAEDIDYAIGLIKQSLKYSCIQKNKGG